MVESGFAGSLWAHEYENKRNVSNNIHVIIVLFFHLKFFFVKKFWFRLKIRGKLFTLPKSVIYTPLRPNPNVFSYNPAFSQLSIWLYFPPPTPPRQQARPYHAPNNYNQFDNPRSSHRYNLKLSSVPLKIW